MNENDLKKLILDADRQAVVDAFRDMNESTREKLFAQVMQLYRIVDAGSFLQEEDTKPIGLEDEPWFDGDFLARLRKTSYPDWRFPRWSASLMVLAVTDAQTLVDYPGHGLSWCHSDLRDMPRRVAQILNDRRPKWLSRFATRDVKQEFPVIDWHVEHQLICSGALPANESADFYKRMALGVLSQETVYQRDTTKYDSLPKLPATLADAIREDEALLETHIWKLFEFDSGAFNYSHSPWFGAFESLCENGEIDREQLLDVSALSMSRSFRPKELAGFGKLHENLKPTPEEREPLTDHYLTAIQGEHSAVVGSALKALEALAKAKKLDSSRFLSCVDAVFHLSQKAQPVKAIKLIRLLIKQQPEQTGQATEVIAQAVGHERPDVQEVAVKELESLASQMTDAARERLRERASDAATVLQARLAALTDSPDDKATRDEEPETQADMSSLQSRLEKIPAVIRQSTDAARSLTETTYFVADIQPGKVPRRDPAKRIRPIETLEELIDQVSGLVEGVDDAIEIERVLDGIARFGSERPDDFDKRVAGLRKRIPKLDLLYSDSVIDRGARIGLSQLLAKWLELEPIRREFRAWRDLEGMLFRERCDEIAEKLNQPHSLLALPTHEGGWVDAEVFVERLARDYAEPRKVPGCHDLAQALFRLTPDGRGEALSKLQKLRESGVPEIYSGCPESLYALGAEIELQVHQMSRLLSPELFAAVHARRLIEGSNFEPPCDVALASMDEDFKLRVSGPIVNDPGVPVCVTVRANSAFNNGSPDLREASWTDQLEMLARPDSPEPMMMMGFLDGLFDPDFTWTREAIRLAVYASSHESKDHRHRVTDAFIDGVDQVRICPTMVGAQMSELGEHLTLKRTAEVFSLVAQVSCLHQLAVLLTLDEFVGRLDGVPKDLHHALTPLLEAALQSGMALTDAAAAKLKSIKGSTKTAKLAKQLVAVKADPKKQLQGRMRAAEAAVERAERWASLLGSA